MQQLYANELLLEEYKIEIGNKEIEERCYVDEIMENYALYCLHNFNCNNSDMCAQPVQAMFNRLYFACE